MCAQAHVERLLDRKTRDIPRRGVDKRPVLLRITTKLNKIISTQHLMRKMETENVRNGRRRIIAEADDATCADSTILSNSAIRYYCCI